MITSSRRPEQGRWRAVRVAVLGLCSLLLGVGAHLAGGGSLPAPGLLVGLALGLGMIASLVTTRRLPFGILLAVLTLEQACVHLVLAAAAHGTVLSGSHVEHTVRVVSTGAVDVGMSTSPAMWLAHALATVATAWLLARGEVWLWSLTERLVIAFGPRPRRRGARPVVAVTRTTAVVDVLHRCAPRRGPPIAAI